MTSNVHAGQPHPLTPWSGRQPSLSRHRHSMSDADGIAGAQAPWRGRASAAGDQKASDNQRRDNRQTIWRNVMTLTDATRTSRRKFLRGAALAGTAAVASPAVVKAQGPIAMRWQSTWPSKDIFHEYALDYAKKGNDMTGGDLKIEVLPAGAVVPAFGLLDAVSKGVLDGGHGVLVYHYGKQTALALWGSGPGYAMDANMLLAWHKYGGGKELLAKLYA